MADTERTSTSDQAAWYRKSLEAVQADVVDVLKKHWPRVGAQLIAHALIETTGNVLSAIAADDPAGQPAINAKLDDLRLFVATAGKAPQ